MKKLTILHSNDLHGDFLAEKVDSGLVGGVSMLSGYISKVRNEERNVIYAIAGDMFRGSLIHSEFKGISTINIMNLLTPDVVTVGNHEVDYGLAHLLFLERCSNFPIINANMYVKVNESRLFRPYVILEVGGMKVLFIGVITEEVLAKTKSEELIGELIEIKDAAAEIRKITDAYRTSDIDLTVLLTRFAKAYTHPHPNMETELGDLLAAGVRSQLGVDLVMLASGTIRSETLGPIVTLQAFMEAFPYHDLMIGFGLTGAQIRKSLRYLMREEAFDENAHAGWFQFSDGFFCEYDRRAGEILRLTIDGKDVQDEEVYNVAVQSYFYWSVEHFLGLTAEETEQNGKPAELASSAQNVLIEYFDSHDYIKLDEEKRLLIQIEH